MCARARALARIREYVSRSVCVCVRITRTNSQRDGRVAMFGGAGAGVVGIEEMILQGLETEFNFIVSVQINLPS